MTSKKKASLVFFSSAIMAVLLLSTSMTMVEAQTTDSEESGEKWTKKNAKKWQRTVERAQLDNAEQESSEQIGKPKSFEAFWSGSYTCEHTATAGNHCSGWNNLGDYAGQYYYETPHWNGINTVDCGGYYCATTDITLSDQPQTITEGLLTYEFDHATSVSCAFYQNRELLCSNIVTFEEWSDTFNRPVVNVPIGQYTYHQTMWKYQNGDDSIWIGVQNNMHEGY